MYKIKIPHVFLYYMYVTIILILTMNLIVNIGLFDIILSLISQQQNFDCNNNNKLIRATFFTSLYV